MTNHDLVDANKMDREEMEKNRLSTGSSDKEYLSIGIGMWSCFYTLRLNYLEKKCTPSSGEFGNAVVNGVYQGSVNYEWTSHHLQNLSQDFNEAVAKAKEIAAKRFLKLNISVDEYDLNEIRRRKHDQVLKDEWIKYERRDANLFVVNEDPRGLVFFFGQYKGENVYDVFKKDREYLEFIAKNTEYQSTMHNRIRVILEHAPRLRRKISKHVGQIKERITITATLVFARHFERDNGLDYELLKFMDKKGNLFVTFYTGQRFDCDIDTVVTLKGTVKKHDEFRGNKQTIINRIKLLTSQKGETK